MNARLLLLTIAICIPWMGLLAQRAHRPATPVSHSISGTVVDPSGALIVNAQVTVFRPDGSRIAEVRTDDAGSFHFDNVPPDKYRVLVRAQGFEDVQSEVTVRPTRGATLIMSMAISAHSESVTVNVTDAGAQVSTEISENQSSARIERGALDRIPLFDQDYVTAMSRFLDDSTIGTSGVSLVVNGVEANGPGVTASAVQEVRINQNPYSSLFARPGRARVEIITKSGTPTFHGSVNFMFRDSVFDAANAFALVKPPEQRRYFEGAITGPLSLNKKTTFLLSLDQDSLDLQNIVNAQGVNGP